MCQQKYLTKTEVIKIPVFYTSVLFYSIGLALRDPSDGILVTPILDPLINVPCILLHQMKLKLVFKYQD